MLFDLIFLLRILTSGSYLIWTRQQQSSYSLLKLLSRLTNFFPLQSEPSMTKPPGKYDCVTSCYWLSLSAAIRTKQSERQHITVNYSTLRRYLTFTSVESASQVTMTVFYTVVEIVFQYFKDKFIICCKIIMKSSDQSKVALLVLFVQVWSLGGAAVAKLRKVNSAANRSPAL